MTSLKYSGKDWEIEIFPENKKPRKSSVAYGLFLFFGTFGAHHFYLRNKKRGFYILIVTLITIATGGVAAPSRTFLYTFVGSLVLIGPVLVYDVLTLWLQVRRFNEKHINTQKNLSNEV